MKKIIVSLLVGCCASFSASASASADSGSPAQTSGDFRACPRASIAPFSSDSQVIVSPYRLVVNQLTGEARLVDATAVGPFSEAVEVPAGVKQVFVSGQLPIDPATNELVTDLEAATNLVIAKITGILAWYGIGWQNVAKVVILVPGAEKKEIFNIVNKAYQDSLRLLIPEGVPYPSRECFGPAGLPKGACVQMAVTAWKY